KDTQPGYTHKKPTTEQTHLNRHHYDYPNDAPFQLQTTHTREANAQKQDSFSHLSLATTPNQLIMPHVQRLAALLDSAITLLFLAFSLNQSPAQQLFIVSKKCFLIVFYFAF